MFLERKIIGRLNGEKALQFQAANGYLNLVDAVHELGETHNFTALVPDLSGGVDPDDSFSKIPYEKGFYFLYYLQVLLCHLVAKQGFLHAFTNICLQGSYQYTVGWQTALIVPYCTCKQSSRQTTSTPKLVVS